MGGGGVQRVLHLVRSLDAAGHLVHVVAVDREPGSMRDDSLLERHPAKVPITRYHLPSIAPAIELFQRARLSRLPTLILPTDLYVDASLFPRVTARASLEVARGFQPDLVIASAPPFGILEAARRVAKQLGIALVIDLRDPWVEPLVGRLPSVVSFSWARALQRRCLAAADLVTVTAPTLQTLLEGLPVARPRRIVTITNGFDAGVAISLEAAKKAQEICGPASVRTIAFTGRLFTSDTNRGSRRGAWADRFFDRLGIGREVIRGHDYHAGPWFEALTILANRRRDLWGRLQTVFVGDVPKQGDAFPRASEAFPTQFLGYQPVAVAAAVMRAADGLILFNPSTSDDSRSFIIPGKLFEYLQAGPPIFAMCGPGDCADIVRRSGAGVWVHDRHPERMADHIEHWLDGEPLPIQRDDAVIAGYERGVLGRRFVTEVETVMARRDRVKV
jgi:glycosyltransferase involved in cell wall biosynthesis